MEFDICQGLGESVSNHVVGRNIQKLDPFNCNFVTNIVMLDIYVLCAGMEDWIMSQSN